MKTTTFFQTLLFTLLLMAAGGSGAMAQEIDLRLRTFLNYYPVQCDSIVVQNTTQGTSTTLYYPDTMLSNHAVGIEEFEGTNRGLRMGILTANPYQDRVEVLLTLPRTETVELSISNELGQLELVKTEKLSAGQHRLNVKTGAMGLHILSVRTSSDQCSVKLVQQGGNRGRADIAIADVSFLLPEKRSSQTRTQFEFSVGDRLLLTTHANAHYYDTVTPIHQSIGLTVSESGTVNFKAFREFEADSVRYGEGVDLRNTVWDVVASTITDFCECLTDFATDMGEEVESQVIFYDSTFCSVRHSGPCNASYIDYEGGHYPLRGPWIYNYYPVFNGKYRVEYDTIPEYNAIVTNLYVGPMDSLCCNLTYHYIFTFTFDYNIIYVYDETRGIDPIGTAYICYFRRERRTK